MNNRREVIKGALGLAAIIAAGRAPAAVVKSMLGANGADFIISNESDFPYVTKGLIAMWDGEWNAGYGIHDPNATVWKNLVEGSPFGNGERTGTGLTTLLPIWTDNSCRSPESNPSTQAKMKACFNVTANIDSTLAVACGETVACAYDSGIINSAPWNSSANMGCDVRFYRLYSLICPTATYDYSSTQYQLWDSGHSISLSPTIPRSYHVRRIGASQLGLRINGGTESVGGKGNGRTFSKTYLFPLVVGASSAVEVFCIRYYSRTLTNAEILHNYKIDKERFNLVD